MPTIFTAHCASFPPLYYDRTSLPSGEIDFVRYTLTLYYIRFMALRFSSHSDPSIDFQMITYYNIPAKLAFLRLVKYMLIYHYVIIYQIKNSGVIIWIFKKLFNIGLNINVFKIKFMFWNIP